MMVSYIVIFVIHNIHQLILSINDGQLYQHKHLKKLKTLFTINMEINIINQYNDCHQVNVKRT